MYATKSIRPRSSLSIEDSHRAREIQCKRRRRNDIIMTLIGFCAFLLVLVFFLLAALVLVGRNIAKEQAEARVVEVNATISDDIQEEELSWSPDQLLSTVKSIPDLEAASTEVSPLFEDYTEMSTTTVLPTTMKTASKVLHQLGFRLPREIKPRKYNLLLQPDLQNKTFSGKVLINFEITAPITFVPVHAKSLNVSTDTVLRHFDVGIEPTEITPALTFSAETHEYWVTEFAEPLTAGNYSLSLNFSGSLTNRIVGLYQSSYFDEASQQTRRIVTSKFEPTHARQAFPCFDEPDMKAKFTVTIRRPTSDGYHALSNMNIEKEEKISEQVTDVTFAESVPMSTYLVCFIVSDFAHKSTIVRGILPNAKDVELRVFATPAQVNKVDYALQIAANITEFYIEYFDVSYPLPKLDLAAIPDFSSGAMEHWGLVTFRETALLYDPTISASANKKRVADVIAHELAHMWFGNLVTMKWWNDLWLNEGFATYIQAKGVNYAHPEWQMLHQFVVSDLHSVMQLDATLASHPIVQKVENPDQITELFDSITYSKGASIIRMLEGLVGADAFRKGTTNYLKQKMFSTAETNDFLSAIEQEVTDYDVKLIMRTWTEQMGLPVVEVTRDDGVLKLKQKRFLANKDDYDVTPKESPFNYRWSIPITYFTSADAIGKRAVFNYDDNELEIAVPEGITWLKFNKDQMSYYRVNYPVNMWQELTTALINSRDSFSESDRAHLINDAFSLADAAQLDYGIALDLSTYLENELAYVPWAEATSCLSRLNTKLYHTDIYDKFTAFVRKLISPAVQFVGIEGDNEDLLTNLLRNKILTSACRFGDKPVLKAAGERFVAWLQNPAIRPKPDLRYFVYYYGMQEAGNEAKWDQLWQLFLDEQDAQEKLKLMHALAAIKEPWILERFINLAWDEKHVRSQDYLSCIANIADNRIGENLVWDFVRENWPRLVERFGLNDRHLGRLIPSITSRFISETKLDEMKAFFAKYPEAGAGTAARIQALEKVKANIKWLQLSKTSVAEWLSKH